MLVITSAVFRIISDSFVLSVKSRGIIALTYTNLVLSALSIFVCATPFMQGMPYVWIAGCVIINIVCITLESVKIARYKKQYRE